MKLMLGLPDSLIDMSTTGLIVFGHLTTYQFGKSKSYGPDNGYPDIRYRSQGWYLRGYPPPYNVWIIISGASFIAH